ncbi:cell wall metabolism sensor histidine kinase WalK [Sebaldella sp. S0638]|uniref:sensor histidine kinase n=1 Tax=Sebaldella sp. S0638 TaxID=2957809 RepID=UPI0020A06836|nr:HAMP domain-containing sensor histidine kinase [Sebaldella sp. S0638]
MKVKINFFQKIFIFSIFIIITTVFLNYIFNIFFLDEFYIHRRSKQILKISAEVKKKIENNDTDLTDYFQNIQDKEGISTDVFRLPQHNSHDEKGMMRGGMSGPGSMEGPPRFIKGMMQNRDMERMHKEESKKIKTLYDNISIIELKRTGTRLLFYEEQLSDQNVLIISTSLTAMKNYRREISMFNVLTTIAALLISAVIGRIFSKKITKDLEKLNLAAKKISILDFSEKISISRNDEIGELSESINTMSGNLESSIENLKSFASNASHELKTPITVINSHAQALVSGIIKNESLPKYYRNILKESIEMNDLVTNLLTISKLSSPGIKLSQSEVSSLNLIKNSIEKYETLELEKDINWSFPDDDFIIFGEEKLLKTAFDNIIQNALKYSKENGIIFIYNDKNKLKIENQMSSPLSKNKELLWEPFSRGENATDFSIDGNGLGLSIVRMILNLNGLTPEIEIKDDKFIFIIKKNF